MARQDSIRTKGLRKHLDDTAASHNGYGYEDFVRMITVKKRPSYTSLGHLFDVDSQTIKSWWVEYEIEEGKK